LFVPSVICVVVWDSRVVVEEESCVSTILFLHIQTSTWVPYHQLYNYIRALDIVGIHIVSEVSFNYCPNKLFSSELIAFDGIVLYKVMPRQTGF